MMTRFLLILAVMIVLAVVSLRARAAGAARRIPVILDTDIGDDVDDNWALMYLLGNPEVFDLKLIVTGTDDAPAKTRLVAKILQRLGRTEIPIATGLAGETRPMNQAAWLGDYTLADYPGTVHEDGIRTLLDTIKSTTETVTILAIGPMTNLAEALRREPAIAGRARIVAMAGSVEVGYEGKPARDIEFNVRRDIKACQAVFAAPWPITMAPLDSCGSFRIAGEDYRRIQESEAPRAALVIENYEQWTLRKDNPPAASSILYDAVAAYLVKPDPAACEMETVKLKVTDDGSTVPDAQGRPVECAMRLADPGALTREIMRALGI